MSSQATVIGFILVLHQLIVKMIKLNIEHKALLLEAMEELLYKLSLELNELKGGPLDRRRKELTQKQQRIEELQHEISISQ